jgi:preprotein translocase subunit SecE
MELEKQREGNWRVRTRDYIEEVQSEMKRVSWPTWPQVRSTTIVVIISTFLLSGYFFVVDFVCNSIITRIINLFTK